MTRVVTCALGYRQEYQRLTSGTRGYRRQVYRVSDGALMLAGPGTDPDYPPRSHPDWVALPREERLAIRTVLDAADEHTGVADYLSERAGRDAVAREASRLGLDARTWTGREADDVRREASQAEYEAILGGDLAAAKERLLRSIRHDRDEEATRRVAGMLGVETSDLCVLAQAGTYLDDLVEVSPVVRWVADPDPGNAGVPKLWRLSSGYAPIELCTLAGLRHDGSLGPPKADDREVRRWRARLAADWAARAYRTRRSESTEDNGSDGGRT
jgi:hypothetical protein